MGGCLSSGPGNSQGKHANVDNSGAGDNVRKIPLQASDPLDHGASLHGTATMLSHALQTPADVPVPVTLTAFSAQYDDSATGTKPGGEAFEPNPKQASHGLPLTAANLRQMNKGPSMSPTAARPKPMFGPQDSRASVYSDTVEIEPVLNPDLPALPRAAEVPSASVTPAGNVLVHLNRAMILQNRMGPGTAVPPVLAAKKSLPSDLGDSAGAASPMAGNQPSTGTPGQSSLNGLATSVHSASAASYGPDPAGDSGIFDAPGGLAPAANGASASGGFGSANGLMLTAATGGSYYQGLDSSNGISHSGAVGFMGAGPPSLCAFAASGPGFGTPLHGLEVEAALSEMQQMALIGSGGGGCVYIGRWRGVTVAIKFIVSSNDDQLTRSQREALLSRLASHPHVVQTYATNVTQLAEQMFKGKEGGPGDAQQGGHATADPNISHDLLAGLTSGSWIRGELQMALQGGVGGGGASAKGQGLAGIPPLSTIMEGGRSSAGSLSATASGRGVMGPGSASVRQSTTAYESDGPVSSPSVTKGKGTAPEQAGILSSRGHSGRQHEGAIPNDAALAASGSTALSCPTSAASSGAGRLLQTAGAGVPPPTSGSLGPASEAGFSEVPATDVVPGNAGKDSGSGEPGPARPPPARLQPPQGAADSFDASFVRDHLGRAKYSIHEVLRQLGAHEGQFLTMVVMEYCDGGSLLSALKEGPFHRDTTSWSPRMLLRSIVRTALEIAHGMQHLHLSGLVHGDLKPGNVLLKGSNQDKRKFVAKVSDLGIVHPLGTADEMAIDDGQIGSIAYMAPEVFRGRIMKASDVYSFGVVVWQLACGSGAAPYEGAHPIAIALGVSEGKMNLKWPPGVFRPLQQLGELCLQVDPAARPSFKSVVGALEKLERHMHRLAMAAAAPGGNAPAISPASSLTQLGA